MIDTVTYQTIMDWLTAWWLFIQSDDPTESNLKIGQIRPENWARSEHVTGRRSRSPKTQKTQSDQYTKIIQQKFSRFWWDFPDSGPSDKQIKLECSLRNIRAMNQQTNPDSSLGGKKTHQKIGKEKTPELNPWIA